METVLVLEDEPVAMRMISATLRRQGYEVLEAPTPSAAIPAARASRGIHLLIADVTLPERSGVRVALELYETFPNLVVLFISGTPFEGWEPRDLLALQMLPRGAWEFLKKPFRAPTLESHVRELLDRSASAGLAAAAAADGQSAAVSPHTMDSVLPLAGSGDDVTTLPDHQSGSASEESRTRKIPDVVFCPEKVRLTGQFLTAIQELNDLQGQQTRAVIRDDPEFSRFDLLIQLATEKKEQAKYELIQHMEEHHCEEGWNRWE